MVSHTIIAEVWLRSPTPLTILSIFEYFYVSRSKITVGGHSRASTFPALLSKFYPIERGVMWGGEPHAH